MGQLTSLVYFESKDRKRRPGHVMEVSDTLIHLYCDERNQQIKLDLRVGGMELHGIKICSKDAWMKQVTFHKWIDMNYEVENWPKIGSEK